jgi:hypothetical protein
VIFKSLEDKYLLDDSGKPGVVSANVLGVNRTKLVRHLQAQASMKINPATAALRWAEQGRRGVLQRELDNYIQALEGMLVCAADGRGSGLPFPVFGRLLSAEGERRAVALAVGRAPSSAPNRSPIGKGKGFGSWGGKGKGSAPKGAGVGVSGKGSGVGGKGSGGGVTSSGGVATGGGGGGGGGGGAAVGGGGANGGGAGRAGGGGGGDGGRSLFVNLA